MYSIVERGGEEVKGIIQWLANAENFRSSLTQM